MILNNGGVYETPINEQQGGQIKWSAVQGSISVDVITSPITITDSVAILDNHLILGETDVSTLNNSKVLISDGTSITSDYIIQIDENENIAFKDKDNNSFNNNDYSIIDKVMLHPNFKCFLKTNIAVDNIIDPDIWRLLPTEFSTFSLVVNKLTMYSNVEKTIANRVLFNVKNSSIRDETINTCSIKTFTSPIIESNCDITPDEYTCIVDDSIVENL